MSESRGRGAGLAVVLARAGSKGVPGKNSALVAGRPCVEWTLEHARRSASIGRVVLSTDDERLVRPAERLGVVVVPRPADLAGDTARVDDALRHAVLAVRGDEPWVALLYGNVPVRPADLTDRAAALLDETACDSVQSYTAVGKHHPWWTVRVADDGRVGPWQGDVLYHNCFRRQDLPPAFVPDGGVTVVTRASLFAQVGVGGPHAFLGQDRRAVVSPEGAVIDIDSRLDLLVADAVLRQRLEAGNSALAGSVVA